MNKLNLLFRARFHLVFRLQSHFTWEDRAPEARSLVYYLYIYIFHQERGQLLSKVSFSANQWITFEQLRLVIDGK